MSLGSWMRPTESPSSPMMSRATSLALTPWRQVRFTRALVHSCVPSPMMMVVTLSTPSHWVVALSTVPTPTVPISPSYPARTTTGAASWIRVMVSSDRLNTRMVPVSTRPVPKGISNSMVSGGDSNTMPAMTTSVRLPKRIMLSTPYRLRNPEVYVNPEHALACALMFARCITGHDGHRRKAVIHDPVQQIRTVDHRPAVHDRLTVLVVDVHRVHVGHAVVPDLERQQNSRHAGLEPLRETGVHVNGQAPPLHLRRLPSLGATREQKVDEPGCRQRLGFLDYVNELLLLEAPLHRRWLNVHGRHRVWCNEGPCLQSRDPHLFQSHGELHAVGNLDCVRWFERLN